MSKKERIREKAPLNATSFSNKKAQNGDKAPLLEALSLNKEFTTGDEKLSILSELNLTVERGSSVAVLGASGSGKSTLLYLLGGLDRPTSGLVKANGRDIYSLSEPQLALWRAREVGFVFQFHYLMAEFDALENVAMPARLSGLGREEARAKAEPLLDRVGLGDRKKHRPGALSGGEQQRVALARALVMAPGLLLADEPTGNLDARNAAMVNDLILELVGERDMGAVVVTHNAQLASLMSRTLELSYGSLSPLDLETAS
ncbi:MAG: ABC transporter ATP-binding protein [Deltaproteobacteria bacterium]|jgi:lipoprotein-releasing system ATP-binding protein|nr:ABC transporter ATP-binding protein [Deltaproteobacteria bacterium]